jgi:hypothetical protein
MHAFGLGNITYDDDFANQFPITSSTGILKSPPTSFTITVPNISSTDVIYPATEPKRSETQLPSCSLRAGGYKPKKALVNQLLNYIGYINSTI